MIFNRLCPHTRVVIGVLVDVWVEDVIKAFVEVVTINVWGGGVVIDELSDVQVDVTINSVSDIATEVLTDVNLSVLVAAMTDLQFDIPAP